MAKTRYKQKVVFKKDNPPGQIYTVVKLVGRVEPSIGSVHNAEKIRNFISDNPDEITDFQVGRPD